jgi:hypothetical protein
VRVGWVLASRNIICLGLTKGRVAVEGDMPTLYTGWELPLGSKLLFYPDATETGARDGPMEAVVTGGLLCCVTWLRWLLLASSMADGCSSYVTRPLVGKQGLSKLQWVCLKNALCCIHVCTRRTVCFCSPGAGGFGNIF